MTMAFVDPRGQILACGSEDKDELVVASLDLEDGKITGLVEVATGP